MNTNGRTHGELGTLKERWGKEFGSLVLHSELGEKVTVVLSPLELWIVFAQLQVALRHPANTGMTAQIAMRVARRLQAVVAPTGALAEVAEMGWDPNNDIQTQEG